MKFCVSVLTSLGVLMSSWVAAAESDRVLPLDGWWDTSMSATCTSGAYQHRWVGDRQSFQSISPGGAHLGDGKVRRSITYFIEKTGRNAAGKPFVRARIPGEVRTDAAGEPVVWDLVFLSPDDICWHRVDRDESSCVQPARRCTKP